MRDWRWHRDHEQARKELRFDIWFWGIVLSFVVLGLMFVAGLIG